MDDLYSSMSPFEGGEEPPPSVDLYRSCGPVGHQPVEIRPCAIAKQPPKPKPRARPRKLDTTDQLSRARSKSTDIPRVSPLVHPILPIPSSAPPTSHPNPWNSPQLDRQTSLDLYTSMQPNIKEEAQQTNSSIPDPSIDMYQGTDHPVNSKQLEQQLCAESEQQLRLKNNKIEQLEKQLTTLKRQSNEVERSREEMRTLECKMRLGEQEVRLKEQKIVAREQEVRDREAELLRKCNEVEERERNVEQRQEWIRKQEELLKSDQDELERRLKDVRREKSSVDEEASKLRQQERSLRTESWDLQTQKEKLEKRETELTQWERELLQREKDLYSKERQLKDSESTLLRKQQDFDKREQEKQQRQQASIMVARGPPVAHEASSSTPSRRYESDEEIARLLQEEENQASRLEHVVPLRSAVNDATIAQQLQQQLHIEDINEQHKRLRREQEEAWKRETEEKKQREENDRLIAQQLHQELNAPPPVHDDAQLARQLADQEDVANLTRRSSQPMAISDLRPAAPSSTGTSPRLRSSMSLPQSRYMSIDEIHRSLSDGQ